MAIVASTSTRGPRDDRRCILNLDNGPVGWSWLLVTDTDASQTFYAGGAVAVDLDVAIPGATLRLSSKRAVTDRERRLIKLVQQHTRTLKPRHDVSPAGVLNVFGRAKEHPRRRG